MDNTSTALVPIPIKRQVISYAEAKDFALVAAQSKMFLNKDITNENKAMALIMIGREMGLGPAASIRGIFLIDGVPNISSRVMAGLIKASGDWDYKTLQWTDKVAEIQFLQSGGHGKWDPQTPTSVFTLEDAKRAGLLDKKGGVWQKYPRNLLWARALTNGFGIFCPHLANGMPVYGLDEQEVKVLETPGIDKKALPSLDLSQLDQEPQEAEFEPANKPQAPAVAGSITEEQYNQLVDLANKKGSALEGIRQYLKLKYMKDMTQEQYTSVMRVLEAK